MRRFAWSLVTSVLVASTAHADEPPAHVEWHRDDAVVEGAAITMAGFYWISTISASIGAAVCGGCTDHSYLYLLIPLAGPAIAAAMPAVQQLSPAWSVILVADSVAQVSAGVVALVAYLVPTKRLVVSAKPPGASWNFTPGAPGAPLGLSFTVSAF